jgi:chromate reductase, NAD(P)H dehydrogenase (quinone)
MREDGDSTAARAPALRVIGVPGSLRRASLNRALLRAARELAPHGLRIDIEELHAIPLFNADLDGPEAPASVARLRQAVGAADGLLLVTPEYNHGVSGVLKNAIDWLSQPRRDNALDRKPTAMMGASTGPAGTARGQTQLRQSFVLTNTPVMLQPEILVGRAQEKFDAEGRLVDPTTRQYVAEFLVQFERFIREQLRARTTAPSDVSPTLA